MLEWIKGNFPTIFTAAVITALIVLAMIKLIKDKKTGKSSCGCCCDRCSSANICHREKKEDTDGR